MKKILLVMSVFVLVLAGCQTTATGAATSGIKASDMPDFYMNPPDQKDTIYGIGVAISNDMEMAQAKAEASARVSIAKEIAVTVQEVFDRYQQEGGEIKNGQNNQQLIAYAEKVSREFVDQKLQGTKVVKRYLGKDGRLWVLMSYSKVEAMNLAEGALNQLGGDTFVRNEAAAFAEWKAANGKKVLEDVLGKDKAGELTVTENQ